MSAADPNKAREKILLAALAHVPFDGWTMTAAESGAADAGLPPGSAARAFPNGPMEMVEAWGQLADRRMVAEMEKRGVAKLKVRERIAAGVRIRLEANAKHREAIRRACALLALPQNAALAARGLYRTVDAIWYAAGDTSTDYNFYTKRGLLAAVYGATVLYWLNDNSEDFAETWAFLDRRIADVMRVPQALSALTKPLEDLPNPFRLFRGGPRHSA